MEFTRIPYDGVSQELLNGLLLQIADYSVALVRMRGTDSSTFQILGSGTLVRRGNAEGILTAHHVLHAHRPPVALTEISDWSLFLYIKKNQIIKFSPLDFCEEPLGAPPGEYNEHGPDLTFLRFTTASTKSTLDAFCSYYPLNERAERVLGEFGADLSCLIHTGFPEIKHDVVVESDFIRINQLTLYGGKSGLRQEDISFGNDGWDYIASPCEYGRFPQLPKQYGGLSGGGIWSALLKKNAAGELEVFKFALVGVNFWHTYPENGVGRLRGHFVRSIYERGWIR